MTSTHPSIDVWVSLESPVNKGVLSFRIQFAGPVDVPALCQAIKTRSRYALSENAADVEVFDDNGSEILPDTIISESRRVHARFIFTAEVQEFVATVSAIADTITNIVNQYSSPNFSLSGATNSDFPLTQNEIDRAITEALGVALHQPELDIRETELEDFALRLAWEVETSAVRQISFSCYLIAPSQRWFFFQRLRVPMVVAGAGVAGMLLAAVDPAQSIAVGGGAGIVSLLVNVLSDLLNRGEYGVDSRAIQRLLGGDYHPTKAALLWVFLKYESPLTEKEMKAFIPFKASEMRRHLQALEKEQIVVRIQDGKTRKWQLMPGSRRPGTEKRPPR